MRQQMYENIDMQTLCFMLVCRKKAKELLTEIDAIVEENKMSKCYECKYEHSDCKIKELERKVEFFESLYQGQLDANEKLLLKKETLEAENKELKFEIEKYKEHIKSLDDIILKLKEENVDLRFEAVRAFERGQKFPCNLDCDKCTEKCRAWQRGFDATCERESGNCDVLKGMNAIAEVVRNTL